MKHFIVYSPSTGAVLRSGICNDADFEQQAGEGEAVIEAGADSIVVAEVNLDPVRRTLYAKIDAQAETVRSLFITPGSGQAITYLRKEQEAAAYLADPNASTPILTAEAQAVGVTVAELAAEVSQNAQAWAVIGAKIEAARRGAKVAVETAPNIAAIHSASQIDWNAVLAS